MYSVVQSLPLVFVWPESLFNDIPLVPSNSAAWQHFGFWEHPYRKKEWIGAAMILVGQSTSAGKIEIPLADEISGARWPTWHHGSPTSGLGPLTKQI